MLRSQLWGAMELPSREGDAGVWKGPGVCDPVNVDREPFLDRHLIAHLRGPLDDSLDGYRRRSERMRRPR